MDRIKHGGCVADCFAREEPAHGLALEFDGSERRRSERWGHPGRGRDERVAGKLAAILSRLRMLWAWQANPVAVSRLDGELFLSESEWAALAESALFAKLRAEHGGGGDGGGGAIFPAGLDRPMRTQLALALEADFDACPRCAAQRLEQSRNAQASVQGRF